MWDLKLDNDGQPIMPKQVRCIENIVGNVDKGQNMYINKNYFEPL